MALRAVKPEALEKRLKMLVYGPPGVGKTTAAIQFPNNYILDLERGCDNYGEVIAASKSSVFQTSNPDDVKQEIKALLTEKHTFRTLTIDPVTQFYGGLQDKWNLIFSKNAQDGGKSAEQIQMADWGFRYWARVKSEYKSVTRMAMQLDMNLIVTSHQKDIYGTGMQRVGVGPDSMKGDDYLFDYVFQLDNIGGKRMARTVKERAPIGKSKFPAEFIWSYDNFCKFYGQDILEKESKPVNMATPAQVKEIVNLLDTVKVEDDWISKCFTKADCESWDEMDGATLQKCIDYLKRKCNPLRSPKMPFPYNSTGVTMNGPMLPDGWYKFEITEANDRAKDGGPRVSNAGDPMVNVTCVVVDDPHYLNKKVFHNLTFMPKDKSGAGIAVHFLKCIGEPWEGEIEVDPQHWVFAKARFMGKVGKREYNGKTYSQINEVSPLQDEPGELPANAAIDDADIPF